jgi:hypothetical protein
MTDLSSSQVSNPHQPALEILHQKIEMILNPELRQVEADPVSHHQLRAFSLRKKIDSIKNTIAHLQNTEGAKP